MATDGTTTVALVGAGPRGTSVLERLISHWAAARTADGARLRIHVIDPFPPGPGHVWRQGQSRLFLMNTQSFFPTVVPGHGMRPRPVAGHSFDEWRTLMRADGADHGLRADGDLDELWKLESTDFPSRTLYGSYLRWTFEQLRAAAPETVSVEIHRTSALAVRRAGTSFTVELDGGGSVAADAVVLSLGHLPSRLRPDQRRLAEGARAAGLRYWPPAVPADVDWAEVPGTEPVLVRGMGLNFFDVMGQLTEGRGGRFVGTGAGPGAALRYEPSGREPKIIAASRRGAPYSAKARLQSYYPRSLRLRHCTEQAVRRFAAANITPGFNHDLWPLLHKDALWAYYSTLAKAAPDAFTSDPDGFLGRLDELLGPAGAAPAHGWEQAVSELVHSGIAPGERLDLEALAAPFRGQSFPSHAAFDDAVLSYLEQDARRSAEGEADPVKMAVGALNAGRAVIKDIVADGGITDESWAGELRGWFEPFVEGLASGPPALRAEQLAALVRAGIVSFVGPDPVFSMDPETGCFSAESAWVDAPAFTARSMIEALAPANRVAVNESPLLEQLLQDGLVRPRLMMLAEGTPVQTPGLDVTRPPYRPLDAHGHPVDGLYVLGLQLSSAQWGTAIAAEANPRFRSGDRTLRDADAVARDILS
ncbi:FAD/NAD(P)-binding protein [Paenarthrobacter sp. DKR-5]|uniref:FAD/NAD(P)-binding protein n=1 Tax=Paenarthrobacter sp. DKR-5 TaxID=2835535 RepID=UPI001BDBF967|nr:FAD/NAD(P)-binding protein [Paenarthrobacter sp. DKR-5]MBT1003587.1 FAD/NAD(P)-binding protein [Paenarthrobacter sp. DKR-5]